MAQVLFPAAACVQLAIRLGDPERNASRLSELIDQYQPAPGTLLVLPELWATGFDYEQTVTLAGRTPVLLRILQSIAARYKVFLAGSLAELRDSESKPFNTLFIVGPEGVLGRMPKQHLFSYWREDLYYQPGESLPPVQTPCGTLGGLICYDLRFPGVARQQVRAGCRVLAVSAEWPLVRLDHWQTLLRARAIENQAYVVAANGCGTVGAMELAGHSMIIGPDGAVLQAAGTDETLCGCLLEDSFVEEARSKYCPSGESPWSGGDSDKILPVRALLEVLASTRRQRSKVAFTNGCFDLLHAGHVSYLERARRTADCLVVGMNSDCSVRALKGNSRPINGEQDRARVLAALGCVDYVVIFDEPTPHELISRVQPDVLVKGADWAEDDIVGATEVKARGGRVERIAFEHDRSTTTLIEKILQGKGT